MDLTVIITTRNRKLLLDRAIQSVLAQRPPAAELVVVDDASTDGTESFVKEHYPEVRYIRLQQQVGTGEVRNVGYRAATREWAFILDDDDTLSPGAVAAMAARVWSYPSAKSCPVFFFRRSEARMPGDFLLVRPEHLLRGTIRGDFSALVSLSAFRSHQYQFRKILYGSHGLLWLEVAAHHGIPTFSDCVVKLHHDGGDRMMSATNHVRRARYYAEIQDEYLTRLRPILRAHAGEMVSKKYLASGTYWLLSGNPREARKRLWKALPSRYGVAAAGALIASALPASLSTALFKTVRQYQLEKPRTH